MKAPGVLAAVLSILVLSVSTGRGEDASKKPPAKKVAAMVYKPNIQYPAAAKAAGLVGSGIAVVSVDSTGTVTGVVMGKSTGHAILDRATIDAFREARFKPGTVPVVKIPIRFTLGGGPVYTTIDVQSKSMDDVLARFLGKGTVLKGPIPAYPRHPAWTKKSGKGVYELHADKDGRVKTVKVLKSSGDSTFDREAVKTLGKWRLRPRGRDLILELPLRFTLTRTNYSVDVGR